MPLLSVNNLTISLTHNAKTSLVKQLSFTLEKGKTLAIVGESGSGKSLTCNALIGLMPSPAIQVTDGHIDFDGRCLMSLASQDRHALRGSEIAMVFQDPMTCLTPHLTIGNQLTEAMIQKHQVSAKSAKNIALAWLKDVEINYPDRVFDAWPRQLSGGMRQRIMIAMALIEKPKLLIADEPTTALDATVQSQILTLLKTLQQKHDVGMIFVSHDLAVVKQLADDVLVMQNGETREYAPTQTLFKNAQSPYTASLLSATPRGQHQRQTSTEPNPLCRIRNLNAFYDGNNQQQQHVLHNITLDINDGEILGLVGESGSGKSTLGRCISGLHAAYHGELSIDHAPPPSRATHRWFRNSAKERQPVQMVFQDPLATLNPRRTIFETLAEPLLLHGISKKSTLKDDIIAALTEVELDASAMHRYPHQFSGGQRQRIAIARALAPQPKLLIADEPVSALDVTIQAQILELFLTLQKNKKLTILFISHDLSVVRYLCNRVAVLEAGKLREIAETQSLWQNPQHAYTQTLLSSALTT